MRFNCVARKCGKAVNMKGNFEKLQIEIYGESHSSEIGVRLGGIPNGCALTLDNVRNLLSRRKSGNGVWATPRKESDEPNIVSGLIKRGDVFEVCGEIDIKIVNGNVRPADYSNILGIPRPSHADYAAYAKDGRISSGGGRFSGRMTAPLCIAGGIAQELLAGAEIGICAYISDIGDIKGASYKTDENVALKGVGTAVDARIKSSDFPLLNDGVRAEMEEVIRRAASDGDSVGGCVECVVTGLDAGMFGDALFEGLESKIAYSVYAIPAVKGVEFGEGFGLARMRGSEANDAFAIRDGRVVTKTNRSGGINGGISNGMPLTFRVAFRPTPSISVTQKSVGIGSGQECDLRCKGRHDACIVPRAVPCVESAVAIALLDELLKLRDGIELYGRD